MDDPFDFIDGLSSTEPWEKWRPEFILMVMTMYGSHLGVGEQQIAVKLGLELYKAGHSTKSACREAIQRAQQASVGEKVAEHLAFEQSFQDAKKKHPKIFKD